MAKEDYETPEVEDQDDFAANVQPHVAVAALDLETAKQAEDAGVVDAAFVDYEEAIKRYEARPDVETLEQRRARENGVAFSEANDLRARGEVDGLVTTKAVEKGDSPRVVATTGDVKEAAKKSAEKDKK